MTGELPLTGTTVVGLEQAVAAPLATRHLADLGARVVKVERLDGGDFARSYDEEVEGFSTHFVWLNRGKESLAVDLKQERGRSLLHEVVAEADVVVQNLAPGAASRLGCGATQLRTARPELVVADLSGYGSAGPYRDRRAYDMLVQAEAGLASVTGTPDHAVKTGVPSADIGAGLYAFSAVLAALLRRGRTGVGASIEVSMFDGLVEWLGHPLYHTLYGDASVPRTGLGHVSIVPYDAFPTRDGQVMIGIQNDSGWRRLCADVLGRAELGDDPRYATNPARSARRREVDGLVAAATSQLTADDLEERMTRAGLPCARLNDVAAVARHPQLVERDRWRRVRAGGHEIPAVLPPFTFGDVEARMGDVPSLGEHTDLLLAGLGHGPDEVAALRRDGVVG